MLVKKAVFPRVTFKSISFSYTHWWALEIGLQILITQCKYY